MCTLTGPDFKINSFNHIQIKQDGYDVSDVDSFTADFVFTEMRLARSAP